MSKEYIQKYLEPRHDTEQFSQRIAQFFNVSETSIDCDAFENIVKNVGAPILDMENSKGECVLQIIAECGGLMDLGAIMKVVNLDQQTCDEVRAWARRVGNQYFLWAPQKKTKSHCFEKSAKGWVYQIKK